jgi:predicted ABC-type ATPase
LGTVLDPDAIARERTPDDPSKSAIFAVRTVLTALADGLENGSRMVYETTLSDKNRHLELIAQAKARGFEVWVLYVGLDLPDMHIRLVQARQQSELIGSFDLWMRHEVETAVPSLYRVMNQ